MVWFVLRGIEEEEEEGSGEKRWEMKEEGSEGRDSRGERRGWCSGVGSGREMSQGMRVGRSWWVPGMGFRHGGVRSGEF